MFQVHEEFKYLYRKIANKYREKRNLPLKDTTRRRTTAMTTVRASILPTSPSKSDDNYSNSS